MRVAGEVRFHNVEIAVAVVVAGRYAHTSLWFAISAESASGFNADIFEGAVFLIMIEDAWLRIVGDINVGPTIVVEVGNKHAKTERSSHLGDSCFVRDIGKRAIPIIVIEDVFVAR